MSSFTLFTLARFTPYEWLNPMPWKRTTYRVNQLNMSNSFWFITGTLLRQASGVNPQVYHIEIDKNHCKNKRKCNRRPFSTLLLNYNVLK